MALLLLNNEMQYDAGDLDIANRQNIYSVGIKVRDSERCLDCSYLWPQSHHQKPISLIPLSFDQRSSIQANDIRTGDSHKESLRDSSVGIDFLQSRSKK